MTSYPKINAVSSGRSPISLYGAPSTTFLHIKRVLDRVIQRARLPLSICEIRDVDEILAANIHTVPTLRIHSKSYSFSEEGATNHVLKQAILDLLQYYRYGEWPCVAVPYKKPEKVVSTFLYAHQLVNQNDSCLELQSLCTEPLETSLEAERKLQNYIAAASEEAMGQILSRPIIAQSKSSANFRDHIIRIERENNYCAIIIDQEDWAEGMSDWGKVYSHLRHPLLLLPDQVEFQHSVNAHWLIRESSVGSSTVKSIQQLSQWFDLKIVIYSHRTRRQLLEQCPALKQLEKQKLSIKFSGTGILTRAMHDSDFLLMNAPPESSELNGKPGRAKDCAASNFVTVYLPQKDVFSPDSSQMVANSGNRKKDFVPVL